MSERLHHSPEVDLPVPDQESIRRLEKHHENEAKKATHEHQNSIEKILNKIEAEAESGEKLKNQQLDHTKKTSGPISYGVELQKRSFNEGLEKVQRSLPASQKAFSKIIHQPAVDTLSEVGSQTIGRSSGLLMGGVMSFIASLSVLFACRYYGYRYNFLIGLVAFVAGFILGIAIEGILSLGNRKKHLR